MRTATHQDDVLTGEQLRNEMCQAMRQGRLRPQPGMEMSEPVIVTLTLSQRSLARREQAAATRAASVSRKRQQVAQESGTASRRRQDARYVAQQQHRASETDRERQLRLANDAQTHQEQRATQSDVIRQARLEANAARNQQQRDNETDEARLARLGANAARNQQQRAVESPQERATRLAQAVIVSKQHRNATRQLRAASVLSIAQMRSAAKLVQAPLSNARQSELSARLTSSLSK